MFRLCGFTIFVLALDVVTARAQLPMGPAAGVRMINTDMAVLEAGETRKDLPCSVTPAKNAQVGFDLRFHAGYDVSVPLRDLAGGENLLTILFRVLSDAHKDQPFYFVQRIRVPAIEEDSRGEAMLQGFFDVGEGGYHVDWLMRDRSERVCSSYWDVEATLPNKDRNMQLAIGAGVVQKIETESFMEDPPVARIRQDPPLSVKVLLNYAPQSPRHAAMRPIDTSALVSILRGIYRDPRIGKFSLVAFSMHEQKVLYRQMSADKIDFPALGEALQEAKPGTVDARKLNQKHGETEFLTGLIMNEMAGDDHPDALVFAGPKALLDENISQGTLKQFSDIDYPVFYMNYNLNPQVTPWRDAIGHAVRFFKGTEYTISRPRDLWFAISEMVGRIVKSKQGREVAAAAAAAQ